MVLCFLHNQEGLYDAHDMGLYESCVECDGMDAMVWMRWYGCDGMDAIAVQDGHEFTRNHADLMN
jgi:hypothetical protein